MSATLPIVSLTRVVYRFNDPSKSVADTPESVGNTSEPFCDTLRITPDPNMSATVPIHSSTVSAPPQVFERVGERVENVTDTFGGIADTFDCAVDNPEILLTLSGLASKQLRWYQRHCQNCCQRFRNSYSIDGTYDTTRS